MDVTVTYEPTVAEGAIRANSRGPRARIIFGTVTMLAAGLFQIGVGTAGLGAFFVVLGVVFLLLGLSALRNAGPLQSPTASV
ncbi:hypothetical protein [Catellatospora sichuanensis]|uniref:hypothetical protein n=1 Tax=Catellatospora sichuanensis TaxID=1969805 RepID=UPI00118378C9|nr:hypothetical protein [Catellatospora sichuanensis]